MGKVHAKIEMPVTELKLNWKTCYRQLGSGSRVDVSEMINRVGPFLLARIKHTSIRIVENQYAEVMGAKADMTKGIGYLISMAMRAFLRKNFEDDDLKRINIAILCEYTTDKAWGVVRVDNWWEGHLPPAENATDADIEHGFVPPLQADEVRAGGEDGKGRGGELEGAGDRGGEGIQGEEEALGGGFLVDKEGATREGAEGACVSSLAKAAALKEQGRWQQGDDGQNEVGRERGAEALKLIILMWHCHSFLHHLLGLGPFLAHL